MAGRPEAEENKCEDSPPKLTLTVPKPSEIPNVFKQWEDVDLPIDILLLAVEDCEFLSCICYLDEPIKSYHKETGFVYFGSIGCGNQKKLKLALMLCSKGWKIPGGSFRVAKAFKVLRPKAVFSVGICSGLNSEKVKLGDVVVASKLTTPSFKSPISRDTGNLSRYVGFGWKPPLENPNEREVKVHRDSVILSQPQGATLGWKYEDIIQRYPEAIAVETEGEVLFTASYADKVEWMIVKGVASYGDPTQSSSSAWASFASTMAASVVASILNDPVVFQEWSHCHGDQTQLRAAIQSLKDSVKIDTEKSSDLQQPFRPNPGEGPKAKDLKIDQIYVNVIIHEGRQNYDFPTDRWEQLKVYPQPISNQSTPVRPQDIIHGQRKSILVVGRPGIGKTMLSTKLLRIWASDDAKMQTHFGVAFLLKFRNLNFETDLNLHDLLAHSETVEQLDEEIWAYIQMNPTKVLLIFDGIDEFSARSAIAEGDSNRKSTVEEKMPLHSLYNKLASGKLLRGATVISTSRPTAVECVKHLNFDRTVEILGFTSEQVEDYVGKFTEADHNHDTKETIWQHIRSNVNIFSLCYIPVNCFIICHCLLQIINICTNPVRKLPTKLTEIYSMTVKIFFFKHNRDVRYKRSKPDLSSYMYKTFDELQPENELVFKRLGKIAFDGIKDGRLVFESSEVQELEDCGLLHRLPDAKPRKLSEPPKSRYCFLHLTIQEFFAAKHITDTMNEEEIGMFVVGHIDLGAWQVVMQFVAGLLKPDPYRGVPNAVKIFTERLPMSTQKQKEDEDEEQAPLTWWPVGDKDRVLGFNLCRCIFEIDVKQQDVQSKIAEIGFNAVDFRGCMLAAVECTALVHFLKNAKVVALNFDFNNIDSLGCLEVVDLLKDVNCNLTKLYLSSNNVGDQGAAHLCDALKNVNCNLTTLDVSSNNIGEQGAAHLCDALKDVNCSVTKLYLSSNNIGEQGAAHLCDALKDVNCSVTKLYLSSNNIGHQGTAHLCGALKVVNCNLTKLHLSDNNIGVQGAAHFCGALKDLNCNLTKLNLSSNNIGDQGAAHLCDALKDVSCNLTKLDLGVNNIGDQGAAHLCDALKDVNCNLTLLDLGVNNIRAQGAAHLCGALKDVNCKLTKLGLSRNKIGEQGAAHLCDALKHANCNLTKLYLRANNIGDQGTAHLCDALKNVNCNLTELYLGENNIGEQGVAHLCGALKDVNCNLTLLDLRANNIGDQEETQLRSAAKGAKCRIYFNLSD